MVSSWGILIPGVLVQLGWFLSGVLAVSGAAWLSQKGRREKFATPFLIALLGLIIFASLQGMGRNEPRGREICLAFAELAALHLVSALIVPLLDRNRFPRLLNELLVAAGYVTILLVLLTRVGVDLTGLITTSAVATAAIGLAMQDTLSNLAAGITLEFEDSIQVGDWIQVSAGVGRVTMVRLRHTLLETAHGNHVLVPNHLLAKELVTIIRQPQRRQASVHFAYGPSPSAVCAAITEALCLEPPDGVAAQPAASCHVAAFYPGHVEYTIVYYSTAPFQEQSTISGVLTRAYFAMSRTEAPLQTVSTVVEFAAAGAVKDDASEEADATMLLRRMEVFRTLEESEIGLLARNLRQLSYAKGELIIRQGESGDSLFILREGKVRVLVTTEGGGPEEVACLGPGDFFGEMSLFTGEARSATIFAAENVNCLRLEKNDLLPILERRPGLSKDISEVLSNRRGELGVVRDRIDSAASARRLSEAEEGLVNRIQRFFGIGVSAKSAE